MPELEFTENSRQMLVFIHLSNLSVLEEAIPNSFPQNFQHPKSSAGPKSPPCPSALSTGHTAFLFFHPGNCRTSPQLPEHHQSSPCIPALPRPQTTSRPVESLLAAVGKREKKAQPNHQLATIPTRTPVAKTPQLTPPQVSSPFPTRFMTASPSPNYPRTLKLTPIPLAPQTTYTRHIHTHTHTPHTFAMPDSSTQTAPPPAPSRAIARPVSEALLNEKVSLAP